MSDLLPLKDGIDVNHSSVQSYLTVLQGVIGRMAANSSAAKTWCITIVSAVVVVIADKGKPEFVLIASGPVLLFFLLDGYYLALEQHFREAYNGFLRKLHRGEATVEDVFLVAGPKGIRATVKGIVRALCSASVWPFYAFLGGMLYAVAKWVLPRTS